MEKNGGFTLRLAILLGLVLCFSIIYLRHSDAIKTIHQYKARKHMRSTSNTKLPRKFQLSIKYNMNLPLDIPNSDPYLSSFSMPPYEALPPFSFSQSTPPFCVNPPNTPQPPSITPSPIGGYIPLPPPGPILPPPSSPSPSPPDIEPIPNPPTIVPSPPDIILVPNPLIIVPNPPNITPVPNPPTIVPSPPDITPVPIPPTIVSSPPNIFPNPPSIVPSPPYYESGPPYNIPSPSGSVPSPIFLPPIVFPPPTVPPPPHRAPATAMWCVAKASVPNPIIQEAMNYACGSGADCDQIQPNGSCFEPNTLFAHASYAFNSYWQRTKVNRGSCDFGGTAVLVTVDPSYDGCHFIFF